MKVLICNDDGQLRRIEGAIAAIESALPCRRQGKLSLLTALEAERAELLKYSRQLRRKTVPAAAQRLSA